MNNIFHNKNLEKEISNYTPGTVVSCGKYLLIWKKKDD